VAEAGSSTVEWRQAAASAAVTLFERFKAAAGAVVASAHPSAGNAWLTDAQLRLYRQSTKYNAFLLSLGALLVSQACAEWIPWQTRTTWWIAASGAAIGMELIAGRLDRFPGSTLQSIRNRALIYLATSAVFATAWASMMIFLWAPGDEINHMALVLILACTIAGSTAISSAHPATAIVSYAISAGFLTGRLALAHSPFDRTLAALSAIYIALMAGQLVALSATSRKTLVLEHERLDFVDSLQRAKVESDSERARAYAAGRAKSQFLSNMNHELRTPMNAILGFSELIKNKSFGDAVDKYAEYAEIIHGSGKELLGLIDDMLDLAKIEGGRLSLRESSVDLAQIVSEAIETNEMIATEARLSVSSRVARRLPSLHADERAIRQIVGNLLSNALKFTPAGGCVTVFAQIESDGRPSFGVEDTGIGIAENDQPGVFERFGKRRHDVAARGKGTGLGLAIVKGFAEAHDGEVTLESALGSGTRVTVTLPARASCRQKISRNSPADFLLPC
jgi:two-component system cell cycle sensor histidine kinase PleC